MIRAAAIAALLVGCASLPPGITEPPADVVSTAYAEWAQHVAPLTETCEEWRPRIRVIVTDAIGDYCPSGYYACTRAEHEGPPWDREFYPTIAVDRRRQATRSLVRHELVHVLEWCSAIGLDHGHQRPYWRERGWL